MAQWEDQPAPDVVDNLTTNDSTKALSAAQGKALNTQIRNHYITFGTTSYTIQVNSGGHAEVWIPFGVTYSSAPTVVCNLGGEQFKGFANPCQIKTNEFQVRIDNVGAAVGNPVVSWVAVGAL